MPTLRNDNIVNIVLQCNISAYKYVQIFFNSALHSVSGDCFIKEYYNNYCYRI